MSFTPLTLGPFRESLVGEKFPHGDFSGMDLSGADLRRTSFAGSNLEGANLSGSDLSGADLSGAHIVGANLAGTRLAGVCAINARIKRSDLAGADLQGIQARGADFADVSAPNSNWSDADLREAEFWNSDLSGAVMDGARLERAMMLRIKAPRLQARGIVAPASRWEEAVLREADLSGSNLDATLWAAADLIGANLSESTFDSVQIGPEEWRHAFLQGADLRGADLRRASLLNANWVAYNEDPLRLARLDYAHMGGAKLWSVLRLLMGAKGLETVRGFDSMSVQKGVRPERLGPVVRDTDPRWTQWEPGSSEPSLGALVYSPRGYHGDHVRGNFWQGSVTHSPANARAYLVRPGAVEGVRVLIESANPGSRPGISGFVYQVARYEGGTPVLRVPPYEGFQAEVGKAIWNRY